MDEKLYDTVEAAAFLGVSRESVSHYVNTGKLPSQKYGRARLIREADLLKFNEAERKRGRPSKKAAGEAKPIIHADVPVEVAPVVVEPEKVAPTAVKPEVVKVARVKTPAKKRSK